VPPQPRSRPAQARKPVFNNKSVKQSAGKKKRVTVLR